MAYLTESEYEALSILPGSYLDDLPTGWLAQQLAYWSSQIDSRLRKRYAVPFASPSIQIKGWLARLIDIRVLLKRGVDATDEQFAVVKESADRALEELREAADGNAGLLDISATSAENTSGIIKPAPKSYSEQSPYTAGRVQRRGAADER